MLRYAFSAVVCCYLVFSSNPADAKLEELFKWLRLRFNLCLLFIPSGAETLAFGAARQNRPLPFFRLDFRRQQSVTVTVQ